MTRNNQKYNNCVFFSYDSIYSPILARDIRVLRTMGGVNTSLATILIESFT
jgi:hypothetical protein